MQLATTSPQRPTPTEYDRFRNHVGAAFAQLEEAKWESRLSEYTEPADITDALRTAKVAVYKLDKALDLGYQNSDDAGSYAGSAAEYAQAGIDALAPFAGVAFSAPAFPEGLAEAMASAKESFATAQEHAMESLHAMYD
jgi:hypothetical protein